jgi:hypothetical protein
MDVSYRSPKPTLQKMFFFLDSSDSTTMPDILKLRPVTPHSINASEESSTISKNSEFMIVEPSVGRPKRGTSKKTLKSSITINNVPSKIIGSMIHINRATYQVAVPTPSIDVSPPMNDKTQINGCAPQTSGVTIANPNSSQKKVPETSIELTLPVVHVAPNKAAEPSSPFKSRKSALKSRVPVKNNRPEASMPTFFGVGMILIYIS